MKGLIRNNFYTVEGSLKLTILIGFIGMIIVPFIARSFPNSNILLTGMISGLLGAFGALSGTSIQKDGTSKWSKFELTLPISRKDVIKARYLSFLLYTFIGLIMAILSALLFNAIVGSINLDRLAYGFIFGIAFAMSIPTFMTPLVLIFGTDKNETLLMISIFISLGLFIGTSLILSPFLSDSSNADSLFRVGYLIFSILLYTSSYMLSVFLYQRKEIQ